MTRTAKQPAGRAVRAAAVVLAGVASLSVLPGAFAAVSDIAERPLSILASDGGLGVFTPSSADPNLLENLRNKSSQAMKGSSALYRFTPSVSSQRERAITVAVRVDPDSANAVSVRNAADLAGTRGRGDGLGIAPVKFNLGVAREYQSFAKAEDESALANRSLGLSSEIRSLDAPDLSTFTPSGSANKKSRFSPQIAFEGEALPGRAPRTMRGEGDVSVDVGGAYRVADNLRLTAGIRYNSDRDRTVPLPSATQDSQAVYVGTRFRF